MVTRSPRPAVARVAALHRYPVKSLTGEPVSEVLVDERGLDGDRLWSVRDLDGKLGSGKSSNRFRKMDGLLSLSASYEGRTPVITFPDGTRRREGDGDLDAALSAYVGRPVSLGREAHVSHFDDGPVHLITTAGLAALAAVHDGPVDPARFRANLLLDTGAAVGFVEDRWVGRRVAIGDELVLYVRDPMPRCVMVGLTQVELPADPGMQRTVNAANHGEFGVVADVVSPGRVAVGDSVRFDP